MKFGETFNEYLKEQDEFLAKCSHVEYKRLKKVLKTCRVCRRSLSLQQEEASSSPLSSSPSSSPSSPPSDDGGGGLSSEGKEENESLSICDCESCPLCDQMFFSELEKQAAEITGYLSSRVRRLVGHHVPSRLHKRILNFQLCFKDDQPDMVQKGRFLIEYVAMNATAMRKILKKYDKVHGSENGRKFKSMLQAQHIELLQSPWLIELGAFCINSGRSNDKESERFNHQFSCELSDIRSVMQLTLSDSVKLEYSLTCAICLDNLFNPHALSCGHVFCKACLCSAASVLLFQGVRAASPESKCPVCRESGVYANAVHMMELDLLLKNRCKEYWKERLQLERVENVKQSKEYWDLQTKIALGYVL